MVRIRARGAEIRRYILDNVDEHPTDISKVTSEHFHITRQAVNKHLQKLNMEGLVSDSGSTRNHTYKLAPLTEWRRSYQVEPQLSEGDIWSKDIKSALGNQPENVMDIWQYGFTEMLNNAYDHSDSKDIIVSIAKTAKLTKMAIIDHGVGIFRKIQRAMNLLDERHALLELAKGKFTTDPSRHTGEGIFFTSRIFDSFHIRSGGCFFTHTLGKEEDWLLETDAGDGTAVFMELNNNTSRTSKGIFDQYSSGEDYGFNKTVVPVRLAQYGDDKLISRSQARRVLARVELFKSVVFDFQGIDTIGHSFADEIFRVFRTQHPEIELVPIHASGEVQQVIMRAITSGYLNGSPTIGGTPQSLEKSPVIGSDEDTKQ
jgi:anti-sigma regulatory factor (Ser/Thr protein kinase)